MPAHAGTKGNEHADILAGMVTITDDKLMDQADRLTVLSDCVRLKTSMCARHSHCQDSKNCKSRSAQLIQQQKKKQPVTHIRDNNSTNIEQVTKATTCC